MPGSMDESPPRRMVVVVSDRDQLAAAAAAGLTDLAAGSDRNIRLGTVTRMAPAFLTQAYDQVVERARRFLDRVTPRDEFVLVTASTLDEVPGRCADSAGADPAVITLLVIDHPAHRYSALAATALEEHLVKITDLLPDGIQFTPSPATVQVYTESDEATLAVEQFTPRWPAQQPWVTAADIVCTFTDSVQQHQTRRMRQGVAASTLGGALADFLDTRATKQWGLHYYTGSVVAGLIQYLEDRSKSSHSPIVRGPSEHSLACSALARWTLDRAPFLIVVTSGMADEFRGTLANLVAARARGFLVCADSRSGQWHPFQGTIHEGEDSREVMRARRIPTVHLDRIDTLEKRLLEAFDHYDRSPGPVVLFATREVLQATGRVEVSCPPARTRTEPIRSDMVGDLVHLLNSAPRRLLCQVGPVKSEERGLVHQLARRAGIALVDSLAHPGEVSRYSAGGVVSEYIGTLSLYGYSARVHEFLHEDGKLRPTTEQALMFINTRLAEIDTPFSPRTLMKVAPIQVTEHATDLAPFTSLGITGPVAEVLREVLHRLNVDSGILADRRAAIESTRDSFSDVIGLVPIRPMTPNYFFRNLNAVLERLIREDGYRYVGVYDVGRAGLSAVCDLPRTDRGFSGWFGRALMGDALQSLPGVISERDENVLAFIGDGAGALVPDIIPSLIQQCVVDRQALRRNLTVFRFVNGGHSVIRTYRESRHSETSGSQTGVLTLTEGDWEKRFGGLTVAHHRVTDFDAASLTEQLRRPATINIYTVLMGHNNEGDGLSLVSAYGWQRDELSSRSLAFAGAPITRRGAAR
jgi:thiamine pyrophosphate-dependent acetolactate synthase large subunit-like protein